MIRPIISLSVFAILAVGVGLLLSGDDDFDWAVALSLFGIAVAGEGARVWIRRKTGLGSAAGKDSASRSSGS